MNRDSVEKFIESDAEKLNGTPVFRGTRVPVKIFSIIWRRATVYGNF